MDEVIDARPLIFAGMIGGASSCVIASMVGVVLVVLAAIPHRPVRAPLAVGSNAPIVVPVDANAPLETLHAALEPLCGHGQDECVFVFGHVELSLPRTSVRIECVGAAPIDGFIVRGKDLHDRLLDDAGVSEWAMLMWADGQLWLTHPSGPGRGPLPDEPINLAVDFFAQSDGRLGELVRAFAHAGDVLALVIVWLR